MFVESEILKSQSNYSDSNDILFEILEAGIINQQIYESIIDNYLLMEKIDEAIYHSRAATDYFEDKFPFLSVLADCYIKEVNIQAMRSLLDAHNPLFSNESLIYKKAEILFMLSDWKALIITYEEMAIRGYSDLDELTDRIIEIGGLTNNLQLSIVSMINISKIYPSHIGIKEKIIDISIETENYVIAIDYFSNIPDEFLIYEDKLTLLALYMITEDYPSAHQLSRDLYEINTTDPQLLEIIFISLLNIGDNNSLSELYSIAKNIVTQFPKLSVGYEALATLYIMEEEYKNALSILLEGQKISDDIEEIAFQLGIVYDYLDNKEKSLESFRWAYDSNSNDYSFMSSLAMAYNGDKQYERCDTIYEDYIANHSSNEALNDYAYLLSDREGINKEQLLNALKMSFRVVKNNMNDEAYLDTVGWIYYRLNNFEKAKYYLEKCVEINDNNIIILEHLGDTYSKLNLLNKAKEIYEKALDINKDKFSLKKKLGQIK